MKTISGIVCTFLLMIAVGVNSASGAMEDYCSAPPYVTRSIPPNIMILLDNSCDMLNSAYDHSAAYDPASTYSGYFITDAYYYGGSQNTFQVVEQNVAVSEPYLKTNYTVSGDTFDIVFKGNFMNWMTMSRFDLLQKILVGGNAAVPRQAGGASKVRSVSGTSCAGSTTTWSWTDAAYPGCRFLVDAGEFRIEDVYIAGGSGSCGILDDINYARAPENTFLAWILRKTGLLDLYQAVMAKLRGTARYFAKSFEEADIVRPAYAGYGVSIDTDRVLEQGFVDKEYSSSIQATAEQGEEPFTFVFSVISGSLPDGLSLESNCTVATDPGSCSASLSGTPTRADKYTFTVRVTVKDSKTPNPKVVYNDKEFDITISEASLYDIVITTATLPSGVVTTTFSSTPLTWIPDMVGTEAGVLEDTISVSGLSQTDTADKVLAAVRIDSISHQNIGNLKLSLKSPSGQEIILSNRRGEGKTYYFKTIFNKTSSTSIAWAPFPFTSPYGYKAEGGLQTITGPVNGQWTLKVEDLATGSIGILRQWSLVFSPDGTTYYQTLSAIASGGSEPYTYKWSICTDTSIGCLSTNLPPGLSISETGEIYGDPTTAGTYPFTVRVDVKDSTGLSMGYTLRNLSITIGSASGIRSKSYRLWIDVGKDYYNNDLPGDLTIGLVQKYWDKAKWGITNFDQVGSKVKIKVNECIGSNTLSTFLNSLDGAIPSNVTKAPLSTAYYGVIKYFQDLDQNTYWQGGCTDPFRNDNVPCRKNFILTVSSAYDVSGLSFSQPTSDCPTVNGNSGSHLVQNACYGYVNDQRDGDPSRGAAVEGQQKLYHYAVYTFGKSNEPSINNDGNATLDREANKFILQDASRAGGPIEHFYDASQGTAIQTQLMKAIEDILSQAASGTAVSVLTTSSRGIGSMVQAYFLPSTLEETREVTWTGYLQNLWIDPWDNLREDTTNDLKLIPDTVTRSDGDEVVKLFFDMSTNETKAATFTTEADGTGGTLGSCTVDPLTDIKPFDEVSYLWEAGKRLALRMPSTRNIFSSKLVTRTTSTTNATITLDATTSHSEPAFDTGMSAAMKSALVPDITYTTNNIINYVRGQCLEAGATGQDDDCGGTANPIYRDRRLTIYSSPTSSTPATARDLSYEKDASSNGNVWKLGDIISSTPKVLANTPLNTYYIDYGDYSYYSYVTDNSTAGSYKNRPSISFVGANDGMVHAFQVGYLKESGLDSWVKGLFKNTFDVADTVNSDVGKELWAYIPYNAFPYLKYLADPDYCHIYYNDLSLRLVDASLGCRSGNLDCKDPDDTLVKDNWRTILVGGMRFGGACTGPDSIPTGPPAGSPVNVGFSSYFAIDITNPLEPVPLWEFSDSDMGYATTFPSIFRTGSKNVNGNWYVAFGSGSKQLPKSLPGASQDIGRTSTGNVYMLNLKTGELIKRIPLDHEAIVGDILAIDADKNYHSEALYFGTAYKSAGEWKGKLVSIGIPNETLTSSSAFTTTYLFDGSYPFTASPDAAKDQDGNIWIYAGSGKYYTDLDEADTTRQLFLGMKHKGNVTYPVSTSALEDKTNFETKGDVKLTAEVCVYDETANSFGMKTVVTSVEQTSSSATVPDVGWYLKLMAPPDPGVERAERVISRPLAVGGLVDFLTYMPSASVCAYGGDSYLYSVGYTTGEAPANVAIRSSKTTNDQSSGNVTVNKGIKLGPGAPPTGEAIIIPPPKENQESLKKKIQIATGVIIEAENAPVQSVISKVMHWLKK